MEYYLAVRMRRYGRAYAADGSTPGNGVAGAPSDERIERSSERSMNGGRTHAR